MGGYFQNYANFAYPYGGGPTGPRADWPGGTATTPGAWRTDEHPVAIYNRKDTRTRTSTVRESDSTGVFVDDTWVVNDRVTVNLGLRYDNMTAGYGKGKIYEHVRQPVRHRPTSRCELARDRGLRRLRLHDLVAAHRLRVDLTDDDKTVLRAHSGATTRRSASRALRRLGPDLDPFTEDTWHLRLPVR